MTERYLFVDAMNLLHRSFHGWKEHYHSDGTRNGAIQGFLKGLAWVRTQVDIPLRNTIIFWDEGRAEGRMSLLPSYKGHRSPKTKKEQADSEDIFRQGDTVEELLDHAGCRQIKVPGVEADDLISIFAQRLNATDATALIFSGDHDFHQLTRPWIKIVDPKKSTLAHGDLLGIWGTDNVYQLPQIKALMGDKSDNIPGLKGVGPKWAVKLVKYFHTPAPGDDPFVRNDVAPDDKDLKKLSLVLENLEQIKTNYKLVALPSNWGDSFYNLDQAESALTQWLTPGKRNLQTFLKRLAELEIHGTLENIHRW